MNSNTCSCGHSSPPDRLAALATDINALTSEDRTGLPDGVRADRILELQRLLNQLEGHWLQELAEVDARGAAGAEGGVQAASTASWLRHRLRMADSAASSAVRTARALFRGPLAATADALTSGEISVAHASALAHGTHELPDHTTAEAEPALLEAARRLDPPRLRRLIGHLQQAVDAEGADAQAQRRYERRGLWWAPTLDGMVALQGLLDPEAGHLLQAVLEPLARPATAHDPRSGDQRRADALTELARRALGGQLPQTGGVRPQVTVVVDLDSLAGQHSIGGDAGWAGPLAPEACRRLACDGALTRVLVSRHPTQDHGHHPADDHHDEESVAARLRTAMAVLPPILGGAPSQPLDVGRSSRVITPAQRAALAVRDNGCVFPDCGRPLAWCEGHHLVPWHDGGPTDLDNLALLCRAHHRTVHEGGWQLTRGPDSRFTATHRVGPTDIPRRIGDNGPSPKPAASPRELGLAAKRASPSGPKATSAPVTAWGPGTSRPPC